MGEPEILIFAPREEPPEIIGQLEGAGCEIAIGDRAWQFPRVDHEGAVVAAARHAVALMGTSIRHATPGTSARWPRSRSCGIQRSPQNQR